MSRALGALLLVAFTALLLYSVNAGLLEPGPIDEPPAPPEFAAEAPPPVAPDAVARRTRPETQAPADGAIEPGTTAFLVTGTVIDRDRNAPVAGALVRLMYRNVTTRTDAKGRFAFDAFRARTEAVRVESEMHPFVTKTPELVPGCVPPPLEFRLSPGAAVSGVVSDFAGNPMAGASVREACNRDRVVRTGKDGRFRITGVRAGRPTLLQADASGYLTAQSDLRKFTPGDANAEVALRFPLAGRLSGVVLTAKGAPAAGVRVYALDKLRRQKVVRTKSDDAGRFLLAPVGPGYWIVRASMPGLEWAEFEIPKLAPGECRDDLELRLGGVIAGRVIDAAGAPASGVEVSARPVGTAGESRTLRERTDAEGQFRFKVPFQALWDVRAKWPKGFVLLPPVRARIGDERVEIRLPAPAAISGRVFLPDGRPATGFFIHVRRGNEGNGLPVELVEEEDGRFRFDHRPPGRVTVFAAARDHWSEGQEVVLVSGEEVSGLKFDLRKAAAIEVCVLDAKGEPLANHGVTARVKSGWSGPRSSRTDFTDAKGTARISGLRPGEYQVFLRDMYLHPSVTRTVDVRSGETQRVTIRLP